LLGFAAGLALVALAAIGPVYAPWEAPSIEPITGEFSGVPWLENSFITGLYPLTGAGALVLPFALRRLPFARARVLLAVTGVCWALAGTAFVAFGALNYFTHAGLVIEQNKQGGG